MEKDRWALKFLGLELETKLDSNITLKSGQAIEFSRELSEGNL